MNTPDRPLSAFGKWAAKLGIAGTVTVGSIIISTIGHDFMHAEDEGSCSQYQFQWPRALPQYPDILDIISFPISGLLENPTQGKPIRQDLSGQWRVIRCPEILDLQVFSFAKDSYLTLFGEPDIKAQTFRYPLLDKFVNARGFLVLGKFTYGHPPTGISVLHLDGLNYMGVPWAQLIELDGNLLDQNERFIPGRSILKKKKRY